MEIVNICEGFYGLLISRVSWDTFTPFDARKSSYEQFPSFYTVQESMWLKSSLNLKVSHPELVGKVHFVKFWCQNPYNISCLIKGVSVYGALYPLHLVSSLEDICEGVKAGVCYMVQSSGGGKCPYSLDSWRCSWEWLEYSLNAHVLPLKTDFQDIRLGLGNGENHCSFPGPF